MANNLTPFQPGMVICGYLRDSGGDRQDLSVDQQEIQVREWCSQHNVSLSRIFKDVARSGGSTIGRDQFLELIRHLQQSNSKENGVLFWRYNRFARDYDDNQYFIADLRRRGKIIHSMMDAIPAGLDGRLFEAIIHWKDAKYLQDLSEDIKRGTQDVLTRFHGWTNATPPLGYKTTPVEIGKRRDGLPHYVNQLIPDSEVAPLIHTGFEMAANQSSLSEILKSINLYHDVTGIARMLKNKIYIGIYEHSNLYIENFCPPLIEQALFDKVQQVRDKARQRRGYYHPRAINSDRYMFTGLVFCEVCGHPLHGQRYHEWRYYICHNIPSRTVNGTCSSAGIRADSIEKSVLDRLEEILNSPSILKQLFVENQKMYGTQNDGYDLSLQRKREEQDDLERQINRIVDAVAKLSDSEALLSKLKNIEKDQNKVRQELAELEANKPIKVRLEDLDQLSAQLKARFDDATDRTKQLILRSLNTRINATRVLTKRDSTLFSGSVEFDFGIKIKFPL